MMDEKIVTGILDKAFLPNHSDLREIARPIADAWFILTRNNRTIPFTIYNDLKIYLEVALRTLEAKEVILFCSKCGGPVLDVDVKWGEISQGEHKPFCEDCY